MLRRDESREVDESCEVGGFFFIAGGHPPAPPDAAEEPFDHVAVFVPLAVVSLLPLAGRVRLDAAPGPQPPHGNYTSAKAG